jgi:hypothetical protein
MRQSFSAVLLRYVHDVASGEFVNVGVVVFSADAIRGDVRGDVVSQVDLLPSRKGASSQFLEFRGHHTYFGAMSRRQASRRGL